MKHIKFDYFDYSKAPVSPNLKNDTRKRIILTSENKKEIMQLERAYEKEKISIIMISIELIQFVINKHKLKNIDELTCLIHKRLAKIFDSHDWLKWHLIPEEYNHNLFPQLSEMGKP